MGTKKTTRIDVLRNMSKDRFKAIKNKQDGKAEHIAYLNTVLYESENSDGRYQFEQWDEDDLKIVHDLFTKYQRLHPER